MLLVFLIHLLFLTPVLGQIPSGICVPVVLPGASENTVSSFAGAYAVKTDPVNGKIFIADAGATVSKIFRFTSAQGFLTSQTPEATFGGTGTTSQATMNQPFDIAFTSTSAMYVADNLNGRILGYSSAMTTAASGTLPDKVVLVGDFVTVGTTFPTSVALDSIGNLWFADFGGGLRMSSAASLAAASFIPFTDLDLVPTGATGCSQFLLSAAPYTIAFDASNNLYLADSSNNRVMVYRTAFSKAAGSGADFVLGQTSFSSCTASTTQSGFNNPYCVTYDLPSTTLFVGERGNARVMLFQNPAATGQSANYQFGQTSFTTTTSAVVFPFDMKYDRSSSNAGLYIVDGLSLQRYCPVSFSISVSMSFSITVSNSNTHSNSFSGSISISNTNSVTNSYTPSHSNSYTPSYTPSHSNSESVSRKAVGKSIKRSADPTPVCGNGLVEGNEECDKGKENGSSASCCSVYCKLYIHGSKCGRIPGPGCIRAPHCNLIGRCIGNVRKRDGTKCYKQKGKCFKGVCNTSA